jgi:hypothetical protein
MCKYYPTQFSLLEIENELPMIKGWWLINCAKSVDGVLAFACYSPQNTYIEQEVDKMTKKMLNQIKGNTY